MPVQPPPRLILASQSPRRRKLLAEAGITFQVAGELLDDTDLAPGRVTPSQWAAALAYLKAAGAQHKLRARSMVPAGAVILGADTVVVKGPQLIGKAIDPVDAARIIRQLESCDHEVITGVALLAPDKGRRILFADGARVAVGAIGAQRIDAYIASGRWKGKAGAYNLEDQVRAGWPITWTGDPTTVMGLPMQRLIPALRALGITPG